MNLDDDTQSITINTQQQESTIFVGKYLNETTIAAQHSDYSPMKLVS
jgi:hypothetical protein